MGDRREGKHIREFGGNERGIQGRKEGIGGHAGRREKDVAARRGTSIIDEKVRGSSAGGDRRALSNHGLWVDVVHFEKALATRGDGFGISRSRGKMEDGAASSPG